MKAMKVFAPLLAGLFVLAAPSHAGVEVKLSVKFILSASGTPPVFVPGPGNFDVSNQAGFDAEVAWANAILDATGRAYRLRVIEYKSVQPPAPAGQDPSYWYNVDARSSRQAIEDAALADPVTWGWYGNGALNIYINNSSSGQCSLIGTGDSISLGATIFTQGTVLHEIGHFFDLSHTHRIDAGQPEPQCSTYTPANPLSSGLRDGDGLVETLPDHQCYSRDQLSFANFGSLYASLTAAQQRQIDDTFLNVMSYHTESLLLPVQMDYWTANANGARQAVCTGRTWFVNPGGSDLVFDGLSPGQAFRSFDRGIAALRDPNFVHLGDDVVLLRGGSYQTFTNAPITAPGTIAAAYGPVTITKP